MKLLMMAVLALSFTLTANAGNQVPYTLVKTNKGTLKHFSGVTPRQLDRFIAYELDRHDKIVFNGAEYGYHAVLSWSPSLCTDGTYIYGGQKTICYKQSKDQSCKNRTVDLIQPIYGSRMKCVDWESDSQGGGCAQEVEVDMVQSPNRKIKVWNGTQHKDESFSSTQRELEGYLLYTIPSCGMEPVPAN